MEPRPWPEDGATDIEKALLRAGRAEAPRAGSDLRILAAIQGSAAPPIKTGTLTRWMKIGLVAVFAGGSAMVAYRLTQPDTSTQAPPTQSTVPASAEERAPEQVSNLPKASHQFEAAPDPSPGPSAGEGPARERRSVAGGRLRKAPAPSVDSPPDQSLGEETKALDRVREALDTHRSSDGFQLLDDYRRRFPQGRLRPEAVILRLAALLQAGRHQAAKGLADQLLSDETYAAYVPRIQSLLREARP